MKHPDPKKHRDLSFIKSGIRIVACFFGIGGSILFFAAFMMAAEFVGIYEELV